MNAEFDPLEAELRSLQPLAPSAGLEQRIANELTSLPAALRPRESLPALLGPARLGTTRVTRHSAQRFAFLAAAVAASILAIALFIRQDDRRASEAQPRLAESPAAAAFDAELPSVWQFRHSLNQSQFDLDAILDQHAAARASAPAPANSFAQTRGFALSDSNLKNLLGEL